MINSLAHKAVRGAGLSREEGLFIASLEGREAFEAFAASNSIRQAMRGDRVDLCSIVSAKTGACPEDCSYCAQSRASTAKISAHPLLGREAVVQRARAARAQGARRFCVVTSGRRVTAGELREIAAMLPAIRHEGLLPCATLGLLGREELALLRDSGLERYHHNLETSREHFPRICTTHTYGEKLRTVEAAREAGLSVCSGGIFGLGEEWADRVSMALELRRLGADSIPVNFLVPVRGTPLGRREPLAPLEALRIICLMRFMLPDREIRVCGGRLQTLGELNSMVFAAGADGLLTGDCLTTEGRRPADDLELIAALGLRVRDG